MLHESMIGNYFRSVGIALPLLIGLGVAIGVAIFQWKKAPTAAMITVGACAVLFVSFCLVFPALAVTVPRTLFQQGFQFETVNWFFRGMEISRYLCLGVAVAALGIAAMTARTAVGSTRSPGRGEDGPPRKSTKRAADDDE